MYVTIIGPFARDSVPTLLFLSLFSRRIFFDRVRILADHRGVVRQCPEPNGRADLENIRCPGAKTL